MLKPLLLGKGHRRAWATPIEVPVLDVAREHGGLVPIKRGGDGHGYVLRSVDEEPARATWPSSKYARRGRGGRRGFGGSTDVVGAPTLYAELQADNDHRVDGRAFLRARLLDLLIAD